MVDQSHAGFSSSFSLLCPPHELVAGWPDKEYRACSHGSMGAGAAPPITTTPSVSLNFQTNADFNMDQPPASFRVSGLSLSFFQHPNLIMWKAQKVGRCNGSKFIWTTSSWSRSRLYCMVCMCQQITMQFYFSSVHLLGVFYNKIVSRCFTEAETHSLNPLENERKGWTQLT